MGRQSESEIEPLVLESVDAALGEETFWGEEIKDDFVGYATQKLAEMISPSDILDVEEASLARVNMIDFIRCTFPRYKADRFHIHVCNAIDRVVKREIQYLMIFAPPQHGKSEIVSTRLPSYWLAHNPDMPVGLISYGASLAYRNSRNARAVFESPFYRNIFPEYEADLQNWRMSDWHLKGHRGYIIATGVGGPITGHGLGLGIIDDPIENWAAAQSDTRRETIWDWYHGTFLTRMWEGSCIVLMMTRWHEDDLAGRILKMEGEKKDGGKWEVLRYSALCDTRNPEEDVLGRSYNEALAPSRYSTDFLLGIKQSIATHVWNAEYQQTPTSPEGDFFKVGRIEIVEAIPAEIGSVEKLDDQSDFYVVTELNKGIRFWDLAATEKKMQKADPDSTSGSIIAEHNGIWYILDVVNEKVGPAGVRDLIKITAKIDGRKIPVRIEQEPGASGKSMIHVYQTDVLPGYDVEGFPSSGDKMVKASPFASQVNAGNVRMLKAKWNRRTLLELAGFPYAAHDDDIDSMAGAFNAHFGDKRPWKQKFVHV